MAGWWRRNPYFMRYMAREATAPFVAAYALVLLAGLERLARGPQAFGAWLDAMRNPWSIAFHVALFAIFLFHTWSWFRIMPKTLPPFVVGGRRLGAAAITALGLAASAASSLALFVILRGLSS